MNPQPTPKVLDALRAILTQSLRDAHTHTAPEHHEARIAAERDHRDRMEQELRGVTTAIRDAMTGDTDIGAAFATLLDQSADPEHAALFDAMVAVVLAFAFQVMGSLVPPVLQSTVNFSWADHQNVPLSPDVLALLVLKGYLSEGDAAEQASYSGMNEHRFSNLVNAAGNPPGPEALMAALRRGIIDQDRFEHGVRQSHIRPEWLDVMTELRLAPPSPSEVMRGRVANQIDDATARALWVEGGMRPEDFDWIYETEGPPPPTQEMIQLWRRGDVTEAQVREALLEGPTKNKWIDTIMKMRRRTLPMEQVLSTVRRGTLTPEQGAQQLTYLGFDPEIVTSLIAYASRGRTETVRDLTQAQYVTAYVDGLVTRDAMVSGIVGLGYPPDDAELIARMADYRREHQAQAQVVGVIRSRYIGHRIDRADASADLSTVGVDPGERDRLLGLWDVARDDTVATLSAAQCGAMFKKHVLDEAGYRARLDRLGYPPVDVDLLVAYNHPASPETAV